MGNDMLRPFVQLLSVKHQTQLKDNNINLGTQPGMKRDGKA